MRKKYFITGATGFVGSWLVRKLVEKEEDVSILVRSKKPHLRLQNLWKNLHIFEGDLQSNVITDIVDMIKPNVVFHLAANGALPSDKTSIQDLINTNLIGLIRLIN